MRIQTNLQVLDFSRSHIGDDGAQAVGEMLGCIPWLKRLELVACSIRVTGVTALAAGIRANNTLEGLDISQNGFDNQGAEVLGEMLASNTSLKDLGIAKCRVGLSGLTALIAGIRANTTLEALDLSHNCGGASKPGSCTDVLGAMLASNPPLKQLRLGHCQVDKFALTALIKGLRANTRLEKLDLSCNVFGNDGASELAEMLASNTSLRGLDLRNCGAHDECPDSCTHSHRWGMIPHGIGEEGARALGRAWGSNWALTDLKIKIKLRDGGTWSSSWYDVAQDDAMRHEAMQVRRSSKLLVFAMATRSMIGSIACRGAEKEEEGGGALPFAGMNPDIFKLIGDLYDEP